MYGQIPLQLPEVCGEALLAHRNADYSQAAAKYQKCLEIQPRNFEARSNLGAALVQLGRYPEAIAAYGAALEGAPGSVQNTLRRNLALAFYKSGQVPEAARELRTIHEADPADRQTLLLLADCYLLSGEPLKTVDLLDAAAPAPEDAAADYLLGTGLIRSGNIARGKVVIDRILSRSDSAESHTLLGAGMFEAHDYPASVMELTEAAKIDPNLPLVHSYLGQALLTTGDAEGAADAFRKELALNPNDFEANLKLGQILSVHDQLPQAVLLLTRAAAVRPSAAEAHQALAEAYRRTGAVQQAKVEQLWLKQHGIKASRPAAADGPPVGSLAPEFSVVPHGSGKPLTLSRFRGKSPVLLVFASYSCPQFRMQAGSLNALYERFKGRVPFVLIYIREAHAGQAWQSSINQREGVEVTEPKDMGAKQENAALCLRKLNVKYSAAVDDLEGTAEKAYAAWPSRLFLVGVNGRIAFQTHLKEQEFRADALLKALQRSLARQQ